MTENFEKSDDDLESQEKLGRIQSEFYDLNNKYLKIRKEANIFCDVIESNSVLYDDLIMGCYYRICNLLGR